MVACRSANPEGRPFTVLRVSRALGPFRTSYQIQHPLRHPRPIALRARPANDERVSARVELVLPAHLAHRRLDGVALELDHLPAPLALHVLVLRITVIVFV